MEAHVYEFTGTGLRLMPETLHVTGIWPNQIARAMSVIDFCIPFGGTISLAMMGAVFNNKITGKASSSSSAPIHINAHSQNSINAINSLPPDILAAFRGHARHAVVMAFVSVIPIIALAVLASVFLGNVKITKDKRRTDSGHLETSDSVEERPFLWALVRGRKKGV